MWALGMPPSRRLRWHEVHPAAGAAEVGLVAAQLGDELGEPLGVGDGRAALPRVVAAAATSPSTGGPTSRSSRWPPTAVRCSSSSRRAQLRLVVGAVDDGDVAGAGVAVADELLEDRADGGDADAGGEEQHAAADALAGGEGAVGALEEDARAGAQVGEAARVVAELAHRDAQAAPVGGAETDHGWAVDEAGRGLTKRQLRYWPGAHRQARRGADPVIRDRPHAGALLDDLGDAQVVAQAARRRARAARHHSTLAATRTKRVHQ